MKRKLLSLLLALVMVLSMVPATAFAAETVSRGKCGTNATWTLDDEGTLIISGSGAISDTYPSYWKGMDVKKVVIGKGITAIGDYAFYECNTIVEVEIPDTVKKIGAYAFTECRSLKGIYVPDSVTSIGEMAFSTCDSMEVAYLSKNLEKIEWFSFAYCTALEIVVIPTYLKLVEMGAFYNGYALNYLYYQGTVDELNSMLETIVVEDDDWFGNTPLYLVVLATKSPADATTSVGGNAVTFTVSASHSEAKFVWLSLAPGAEEWEEVTALTGCKTKKLTVPAAAKYDGYQFCCYMYVDDGEYGVREAVSDPATMRVVPGPAITAEPQSVEAKLNESLTVSFTAEGEGLKYEWYYKDAGATKFTKTSTFTGPEYTTTMTEARAGRQIYCVVTDKYGSSVQTNTVTLTLDSEVVITKQPADVTVAKGQTVEVSFTASGLGLKYEWYFKNAGETKFTKTTTFTGNTYTTEMNEARNGRQIYCIVTDKFGASVQTDTVTLSMLPLPEITVQPQSVEAKLDESLTVSFTAEGEDLKYEWYYKDAGASKFTKTSTFTGPEYTTTMTEARAGRQIYCVVTDKYGVSVQTNTVTLALDSEITITKQPADVTVAKGQMAEVSFTASGLGLKYEWYFKNAGDTKFTKTTTFTGPEYTTEMNEARAGRQIYCVVTDKFGNTAQTETVTLGMLPLPEITVQPQSVKAKLNESLTVSFTAEGEDLKYEWYYKDAGASKFTKTSTFTGPEYTTTMTEARAGRQIYCVVTDKYGVSVQTNTVTLALDSEITITKQPADVTVAKGQTAKVSFTASGLGLKYEWYFKNAGDTKFTKTTTFTGPEYSAQMNEARAGRQIYCVVTDKYGASVQTETVTLGMLPLPEITVQLEGAKAKLGENLKVSFAAEGEGLKYEWYYKNAGASSFIKTSTFSSNYYEMEMTEARAGRQIYCVVTDKYGVSVQTNTVTLALDSEITITKQPADVTVAKGQMAEVSFTASGLGLKYEWYFKNAGETKFTKTTTFTGPEYSAQMNEARAGRQIYCVVTDKYGASVQTDTVTLGMLPLPEITVQPESVKGKDGETVTVSFTAEGEGLKYEWYYKNKGETKFTKTSTFTGPEYTTAMNTARAGRQIYCVVTDKYGVSVQTETVTLQLDTGLAITKQPESVTAASGKTVTVSFTAEGEGLTYEWYYKNAGASDFVKTTTFTGPEYTTVMNATRAGRQIYCVVTDKYGTSVKTDTVTLNMA